MSNPGRATFWWFLVGGIAMSLVPGCDRGDPPPLRILAASSLQPLAVSDPDSVDSEISVGASSVLAMQLMAGATADVVLLADDQWMDQLVAEGVVVPGSRVEVARNRIVLAVPGDKDAVMTDGVPSGRVAIAEPRNVPLGRYSMEVLEALEWWDPLENRLVLASDARAVLALVESGQVDAGIVYASDASRSEKIDVMRIFDAALHRPIRCEAALISNREASRRFVDRLKGPSGRTIAEANGFQSGLVSQEGDRP